MSEAKFKGLEADLSIVHKGQLLKLVVDLIKIFSWDKSFRQNLWLGNVLLNRLGLHVFRVCLAHLLFNWRLLLLGGLSNRAIRRSFKKDGVVKIENFLQEDLFLALVKEVSSFEGEVRQIKEGATLTERVGLDLLDQTPPPFLLRLMRLPALIEVLRYCSSKNRWPLFHIEHIRQHFYEQSGSDPQQDLHADAFHPTVKAWLFLSDVDASNGPFCFVEGSQQLTWKRIKWEYQQSVTAAKNKNNPNAPYWDGSFRLNPEHLSELGLPMPTAFKVKANTLLIANTFGFHRRGTAERNQSRLAIWMQMRDNPFVPLPNLFPAFSHGIFLKVWKRLSTARDRKLSVDGNLNVSKGKLSL